MELNDKQKKKIINLLIEKTKEDRLNWNKSSNSIDKHYECPFCGSRLSLYKDKVILNDCSFYIQEIDGLFKYLESKDLSNA
jgi:DNA-directed RNA polymerase subunit RPC12/RpoP